MENCPQCGDNFARCSVGRPKIYCDRACAGLAWRARNVHRRDERNEAARWSNIQNKYGLSKEAYLALDESQGGVCASCGDTADGGRTSSANLHVDHCHSTGRVRGLLCSRCNTALGLLKDSTWRIECLAQYLKGVSNAD